MTCSPSRRVNAAIEAIGGKCMELIIGTGERSKWRLEPNPLDDRSSMGEPWPRSISNMVPVWLDGLVGTSVMQPTDGSGVGMMAPKES